MRSTWSVSLLPPVMGMYTVKWTAHGDMPRLAQWAVDYIRLSTSLMVT